MTWQANAVLAYLCISTMLGCVSCKAETKPQPADKDVVVLRESRDREELERAALAFAASTSPEDHETLGEYLASKGFLERLDSPEDYQGTYIDLRLARVMEVLMENRMESVDKVLIGLIDSPEYQDDVLRMQLCIRALAVVRPSPAATISYWGKLGNPESPIAYDVVEALCTNQSKPAIELLEGMFTDDRYDPYDKLGWMREVILPRRYDEPLLGSCERLVTELLTQELRIGLVEALFDYKPDEWYVVPEPPTPPPLTAASRSARKILNRIGEYALNELPLTGAQKGVVEAGLE